MTSSEIGGAGRSGPGVLEAGISGCQEQAGRGVSALSAHGAFRSNPKLAPVASAHGLTRLDE